MDLDKLEYEFAKLDEEGLDYWLTNYFIPESTAFEGKALEILIEARSAIIKAEEVLEQVREEYDIEYT